MRLSCYIIVLAISCPFVFADAEKFPQKQSTYSESLSEFISLKGNHRSDPIESFVILQSVTIDSGESGLDEGRGVSIGPDDNLYITGYVTRAGNGRDIWLAKYDLDLGYIDSIVINGPANGDDEGYTMAFDDDGFLYVVGYMTEVGEYHDIWLGKFNLDLVFQNQWTPQRIRKQLG